MTNKKNHQTKPNTRRMFLGYAVTGISAAMFSNVANHNTFARETKMKKSDQTGEQSRRQFGFAIHGGAGVITRTELPPAEEKKYREALAEALTAGHRILRENGTSLDAVEAAIKILEDNPLFNAGKGAVFTNAGTNELDASIMDGRTLKAGAVSNLRHIKNPISLARMVMERSPHVMMVGEGAETFARQEGVEMVPQSYFYTEKRWQAWQKMKQEAEQKQQMKPARPKKASDRHGTVGAVALDKAGNLAAGTSTGGMTNKKFGRVGDSPIIGAGTYANNATCAVSATGDGEYFIRSVVAHDISAMMAYKNLPLQQALQTAIENVGHLGGEGGVIGIDRDGHVGMYFNGEGMYRGSIDSDGKMDIKIFKE